MSSNDVERGLLVEETLLVNQKNLIHHLRSREENLPDDARAELQENKTGVGGLEKECLVHEGRIQAYKDSLSLLGASKEHAGVDELKRKIWNEESDLFAVRLEISHMQEVMIEDLARPTLAEQLTHTLGIAYNAMKDAITKDLTPPSNGEFKVTDSFEKVAAFDGVAPSLIAPANHSGGNASQ